MTTLVENLKLNIQCIASPIVRSSGEVGSPCHIRKGQCRKGRVDGHGRRSHARLDAELALDVDIPCRRTVYVPRHHKYGEVANRIGGGPCQCDGKRRGIGPCRNKSAKGGRQGRDTRRKIKIRRGDRDPNRSYQGSRRACGARRARGTRRGSARRACQSCRPCGTRGP